MSTNDTFHIFLNFDNLDSLSLFSNTTIYPESGQWSILSKYLLNKYTMFRFLVIYGPSCLIFHLGDGTLLLLKMRDQLACFKDLPAFRVYDSVMYVFYTLSDSQPSKLTCKISKMSHLNHKIKKKMAIYCIFKTYFRYGFQKWKCTNIINLLRLV